MSEASEIVMQQAVGELKESNKIIAESMGHIKDNLKTLNDNNILHAQKEETNHQKIIETMNKYWWLIVILFVVILVIMGYKEAVTYVVPGI